MSGPTGWMWKGALLVGFLVVVGVNIAFTWVAVTGADPVAASYEREAR